MAAVPLPSVGLVCSFQQCAAGQVLRMPLLLLPTLRPRSQLLRQRPGMQQPQGGAASRVQPSTYAAGAGSRGEQNGCSRFSAGSGPRHAAIGDPIPQRASDLRMNWLSAGWAAARNQQATGGAMLPARWANEDPELAKLSIPKP
ncbi:hypothetical protein ABPG75_012036 [Micractinium tetrahymenae]